jgi:hypothetical protein
MIRVIDISIIGGVPLGLRSFISKISVVTPKMIKYYKYINIMKYVKNK